MLEINLVSKKVLGVLYPIHTKRMGVKCLACGWEGYRKVQFVTELEAQISRQALSTVVRLFTPLQDCPKCSSADVYHTHVTEQIG